MNLFLTKFKLLYGKVTGNIAFYPSLIAVFGLLLAFGIMYIDNNNMGASKWLLDTFPTLVINDADTARTMLSTFIAGNVSLMVFSFSMVMLLLNKASTSYSPRILPGLISNKRHQHILGFYIAVIIYCILVLLSIKPTTDSSRLPALAILIGIVLSVNVLAAFIYFIHSISQSIQINNIIDRIYNVAHDRLHKLIDTESNISNTEVFDDSGEWYDYEIEETGHLNDIALDSLKKLATEKGCRIKILVPKGIFLLDKMAIASVSQELNEEDQEKLLSCFSFSKNEIVENNYILSFKQLTEIAVKSMSPGINDPATAITCLNYLTQLFALRMKKKDDSYIKNDNDKVVIALKTVDFEELLYFTFASLRQYSKQDFIVMHKLLSLIYTLSQKEARNDYYYTALKLQTKLIEIDMREGIKNPEDLKRLKQLASSIEDNLK